MQVRVMEKLTLDIETDMEDSTTNMRIHIPSTHSFTLKGLYHNMHVHLLHKHAKVNAN